MRVYLDVCCLNRPFDDQRQARIRLEAEAVERIIERLHMREWEWVGSDVLYLEINKTPDLARRRRAGLLASGVHRVVTDDQFEHGQGDYSKERYEWLQGLSVEALADELRKTRERR